MKDLIELLEERVARDARGLAFTFLVGEDRVRRTYEDLWSRARSIASLLQGIAPAGSRVVLLYPPGLDYIDAFFGCLLGGHVAVPAYPPDPSRLNRTLPRLQAIVDDAGADVVLTTSAILSMTDALAVFAPALASKKWLATDGAATTGTDAWQRPRITGSSLAFLQYTSGSTGTPKGVMLSHGNLLENERMIRDVFALNKDSVGVGWLPLYHDMGLIGNVLQPIYVGFPCHLMSPLDFLQRPLRWLQAISEHRGTSSGGPNFAYELCVRKISDEEREALDLRSWSLAFCGAEPVRADTLARFASAFSTSGFRSEAFLPCYGLAEASLLVSGKRVGTAPRIATLDNEQLEAGRAAETTDERRSRTFVSNGPPIEGTTVLVVNPATSLRCVEGEIGEIWVSGPHVASGYWADEAKSARTFGGTLAGSTSPGTTNMLRTGDLGFFHGGELYVSGRLKDLIIIRGKNYYPQDIERVVEESYSSIRRGCVAAFAIEIDGEERVVVAAEVDRRSGGRDRRGGATTEFDPQAVAAAIRADVAEVFGLRCHAVLLLKAGAIPKTSSGKIQRHACAAGFLDGTLDIADKSVDGTETGAESGVDAAALLSAPVPERLGLLENHLRAQIARALGVATSSVDPTAVLTSLGIDSLMAVELTHRIERALSIVVPMSGFLRPVTVGELAAQLLPLVERASSHDDDASAGAEDGAGLSLGQESMWFLHRISPQSSAYNVSIALDIEGVVDEVVLETSLRALVERHPPLYTTYSDSPNGSVGRLQPSLVAQMQLTRVDLAGRAVDEVRRTVSAEANRPFDLSSGPIIRATLFRRGGRESTLLVSCHHIATDFSSAVVMIGELRSIYAATRAGRAPSGLGSSASYASFARWQRSYLASEEANRDWAYWRELADFSRLDLPTDRPRPPVQTFAGAELRTEIPRATTDSVVAAARSMGVTAYSILLAAYQVLLGRFSCQNSFLIGTPVAGRPRAAFGRSVGYFVNTVCLRAELSAEMTARELVERTGKELVSALEHQNFPFLELVARTKQGRDPSRSPLYQASFALERIHGDRDADIATLLHRLSNERVDFAGGLVMRSHPLEQVAAQADIGLSVVHSGGDFYATFEFNTDLFDRESIERMAVEYVTLLEGMLADPELPLERLPTATHADEAILARVNDTTRPFPEHLCLHELLEARVDEMPDAMAVEDGDIKLTFAELDGWANAIAAELREAGIKPESFVPIYIGRSVDFIANALGVLKSGGAYVPIDPSLPADRVAFMLEDVDASVVLASPSLEARATEMAGGRPVKVIPRARAPRLPRAAQPTNVAYAIYTSGSTGKPKCVVVEHRSIVCFVVGYSAAVPMSKNDRMLHCQSPSFDVTLEDAFVPLYQGATVVVRDDQMAASPRHFVDALHAKGITIFDVPTPYWAELTLALGDDLRLPDHLRLVVIGGDRAWLQTIRDFDAKVDPRIGLVNGYGPTETTVGCLYETDTRKRMTSIGVPLQNMRVHVVSPKGIPLPVGAIGELWMTGVGVTRGYHRRPDLTAEKFVSFQGERAYRTGDRVRITRGGFLEFFGRFDHQVKIRGYRVELGEVESAISAIPGVSDIIVTLGDDGQGNSRLLAYYAGSLDEASLRKTLAKQLPGYMIPSFFTHLDALPYTTNGKVDRKRLPTPEIQAFHASRERVAPRNETETELCAIAARLLGLSDVGIEDNFFEMGGHSLLATRFIVHINATFHTNLDVRDLFAHPTIASLAESKLSQSFEEGEI